MVDESQFSSSVTRSGSGGSHGLGCRAQSSRRAAEQTASTRTDRSVAVLPSSSAAASPNGKTLIVSNYDSNQIETVAVAGLP